MSANVTWNGENIGRAASASNAFSFGSSTAVDMRFDWSVPSGLLPSPVATARVQMFFMGFGIATRDVTQGHLPNATSGVIDLYWNGTGLLADLIEGNYQVTASLLDKAGSSLWSENFFVSLVAPYHVLAASPIILLIVAIYEIVVLATARRGEKITGAPPKGRKGHTPDAAGAKPGEPDASGESTDSPDSGGGRT